MADVVLVHGIAQQTKGPQTLLDQWLPALRDGVTLAGNETHLDDVAMAFYGDIFRPAGSRAVAAPPRSADDVTDPLERDLLLAWWAEAARLEPAVPGPDARTRLRTPHLVQRALHALSHSSFFGGLAEHLLIGALAQVRRYLTEDEVRDQVGARLAEHITDRTRLVIAHSLGSVVAYETLCRLGGVPRIALITLGSPLGIPNLIFERLRPPPATAAGVWPAGVRTWTNIADRGDVVALVKSLGERFPGALVDVLVHNGAQAHDVMPYLTAAPTGAAVAAALPPWAVP